MCQLMLSKPRRPGEIPEVVVQDEGHSLTGRNEIRSTLCQKRASEPGEEY